MSEEAAILAVHDVHTYYGQSHVIQGVSLRVAPGEIVGLIGRNGAGKTTTLKTIMGVTHARRGAVTFAGEDVTRLAAHEIARRGLTLVPEDRRIFPKLTVAENLKVAWLNRRAAGGGAHGATLEEVFEYFPRLRERLDQPGANLSGGEQQMLALARGLVARPRLMLVDELTGGLMPVLVESLTAILGKINEGGMTVLLVEQDLDVVLALAHRCYVLDQGRVQFEGTADELRANHEVQQRYLGVA